MAGRFLKDEQLLPWVGTVRLASVFAFFTIGIAVSRHYRTGQAICIKTFRIDYPRPSFSISRLLPPFAFFARSTWTVFQTGVFSASGRHNIMEMKKLRLRHYAPRSQELSKCTYPVSCLHARANCQTVVY